MSARPSTYIQKTDKQREILQRYYDEKGMTSKGAKCKELIEEAAKESCLTVEQVKNWICSESRKRRSSQADVVATSSSSTEKKAKMTYVRGPTAYNNFYTDLSKSDQFKDLSMQERNSYAAQQWNKLSDEEKLKFKERVEQKNLTEEEREKVVKRYNQQLRNMVNILEEHGSSVLVMTVTPSGQLYCFGSQEGQEFMASNPDVLYKFKSQFSEMNPIVTYKDITKLYNQKYSEMVGRPSRVPYLKGGFEVKGLPDGIAFKKPFMYGSKQIKRIIAAKVKYHFILLQPLHQVQQILNQVQQTLNQFHQTVQQQTLLQNLYLLIWIKLCKKL
ncbi:general transcription factor II-I repeat domain-containing protein 1 [Exaiptasia diaphana]|uniref:HMG box domain-containing protein n=1 Tax=Exaiptasia diaphana TaxID=2652724 RepID=A0A913YIF6_EXADI|nr:general transcription factor II-I repeat domain-containing protein 1 [Exaiptasia diaphana]